MSKFQTIEMLANEAPTKSQHNFQVSVSPMQLHNYIQRID